MTTPRLPRDTPTRTVQDVDVLDRELDDSLAIELEQLPTIERPAPSAGRLQRLRARLARSQIDARARACSTLLSRDQLDEDDLGGGRGDAARRGRRRRPHRAS